MAVEKSIMAVEKSIMPVEKPSEGTEGGSVPAVEISTVRDGGWFCNGSREKYNGSREKYNASREAQ